MCKELFHFSLGSCILKMDSLAYDHHVEHYIASTSVVTTSS